MNQKKIKSIAKSLSVEDVCYLSEQITKEIKQAKKEEREDILKEICPECAKHIRGLIFT